MVRSVGAVQAVELVQQTSAFRHRIVVATVAPWLLVIVAHHAGMSDTALLAAAGIVLAAHVATSALFYFDPDLDLPHKDPVRYVVAPVAAVGVAVAAYASGGVVLTGVLLAQQVWQIHHFTRQNLGVFSLYARARGGASLTGRERRLFDLTSWAGMVGSVGLVVDWWPFQSVGLAFLAAAVVLLIVERPESWRLVALAAAIVFYLPLFLYPVTLPVATAAFAFAHGTQYLAMMGTLRRSWLPPMAVILVGYSLAIWSGFGVAVLLGVSMTHFIVDAGVWKMRDPAQRAYITGRLPWLAPAGGR